MTAREKMKAYREKNGYSVERMSRKSGASAVLIRMVENGNVTHPEIAAKIGKAYKLDKEDIYELIPENYRPGENYDPDKYVEEVDYENDRIFPKQSSYDNDYYGYLAENSRALRKYGKRGVVR